MTDKKLFYMHAAVATESTEIVAKTLKRYIRGNLFASGDGIMVTVDTDGSTVRVFNVLDEDEKFVHGLFLGILALLPSGIGGGYVHVYQQLAKMATHP